MIFEAATPDQLKDGYLALAADRAQGKDKPSALLRANMANVDSDWVREAATWGDETRSWAEESFPIACESWPDH